MLFFYAQSIRTVISGREGRRKRVTTREKGRYGGKKKELFLNEERKWRRWTER